MVDWRDKEAVREYQRVYRENNKIDKERLCVCGTALEKYRHLCPKCKNIHNSQLKLANKARAKGYQQRPEIKAKAKEYYEKYAKGYYEKNKERVAEWSKRYWVKNKERVKEYRQRPDVKKKRQEYCRKYYGGKYKNDIQYKLRIRLASSFRYAIKRYIKVDRVVISKNKNIDYKAIIEQLTPFPNNVKDFHIDHIIPLDFFDLTKEEHIKKALDPINFQWLKCSDNISKNNNIDFNKYPEQEFVWNKLKLDKC